ncbi:hypothetical protein KIW84_071211 [Lathyrus oleraceus]|uniref:Uncharacterized protein n=1 Tax=Pisum sativum TaxID=3888 RepID=A0A9D4VJX0_PEA|nr:hypothetical protein KIW84_071211 [Pisum sativum]
MTDNSSATSDDQNKEKEIFVPKDLQRVIFGESHFVQITTFRLNGSNYFRIIGRETLPSLGEVFSEIRREETRRSVMMGKIKIVPPPLETNALAAETTSLKSSTSQKNFSNLRCDHCNKPHHTRETCWKIHGRPSHLKGSKSGPKVHRPFPTTHEAEKTSLRKEQVEELIRLLNVNFSSGTPSGSVAQTGKGNITLSENINLKKDRTSGKMIDSAKMMDGLYYFEDTFENKEARGLSGMCFVPFRDQIMLWDKRLGS